MQSSPHRREGLYSNSTLTTPAGWSRRISPTHTASSNLSGVLRVVRWLVPPRLDIHPLDLLARMSPLAFIQCMIYSHLSGELDQLWKYGVSPSPQIIKSPLWYEPSHQCLHPIDSEVIGGISVSHLLVLLLNGCIAFGLNVVSFSANGKVGPLSMTVAGMSRRSGFRASCSLLCSQCKAGLDDSLRGINVQSHHYAHERPWYLYHDRRRSLVWLGRICNQDPPAQEG